MTLFITDADGATYTVKAPASIALEGADPGPEPDPDLGADPDPAAQTGKTFLWKARVKDPDSGVAVEYGSFPYRRSPIVLADGSSHPGYNDGDRDSYRATQTHIDNDDGDHIARVVLAGGYTPTIDAVVLDRDFSDHTMFWYDLSPYDGGGSEGNDIPVRDGVGDVPVDDAVDLRLVHRPTGTVVDARPYSQLVDHPDVVFAVTEAIDEPFKDVGRAEGAAEHDVQSRVRITFWFKGLEAHNYYFDSMHADYYWHVS